MHSPALTLSAVSDIRECALSALQQISSALLSLSRRSLISSLDGDILALRVRRVCGVHFKDTHIYERAPAIISKALLDGYQMRRLCAPF